MILWFSEPNWRTFVISSSKRSDVVWLHYLQPLFLFIFQHLGLIYQLIPGFHVHNPKLVIMFNWTSHPSGLDKMRTNPIGNYMFKVNNRNTRTRSDIFSKLTIKTPERHQFHIFFSVSVVSWAGKCRLGINYWGLKNNWLKVSCLLAVAFQLYDRWTLSVIVAIKFIF